MSEQELTQILRYTDSNIRESVSREQERYDQGNAFISLIKLSFGPLIYQFGIALHDALDLFLITKALGESSLQVVGFSTMMRYLGMSVKIGVKKQNKFLSIFCVLLYLVRFYCQSCFTFAQSLCFRLWVAQEILQIKV